MRECRRRYQWQKPNVSRRSQRFSADVIEKLEAHSNRLGESKARVAERLIDEGLRVEEFPGIIFRSGPTGRRAGIARGPDVWEVIRDLKQAASEGAKDPIKAVAIVAGLSRSKIELAAAYYAAHPEEVDDRIRMEAASAERLRRALGIDPAA